MMTWIVTNWNWVNWSPLQPLARPQIDFTFRVFYYSNVSDIPRLFFLSGRAESTCRGNVTLGSRHLRIRVALSQFSLARAGLILSCTASGHFFCSLFFFLIRLLLPHLCHGTCCSNPQSCTRMNSSSVLFVEFFFLRRPLPYHWHGQIFIYLSLSAPYYATAWLLSFSFF